MSSSPTIQDLRVHLWTHQAQDWTDWPLADLDRLSLPTKTSAFQTPHGQVLIEDETTLNHMRRAISPEGAVIARWSMTVSDRLQDLHHQLSLTQRVLQIGRQVQRFLIEDQASSSIEWRLNLNDAELLDEHDRRYPLPWELYKALATGSNMALMPFSPWAAWDGTHPLVQRSTCFFYLPTTHHARLDVLAADEPS